MFPVQCEDTELDNQVAPADDNDRLAEDFIDLREDVVFPVQCTEQSLPNLPLLPHRSALTICLDVLLWEFRSNSEILTHSIYRHARIQSPSFACF